MKFLLILLCYFHLKFFSSNKSKQLDKLMNIFIVQMNSTLSSENSWLLRRSNENWAKSKHRLSLILSIKNEGSNPHLEILLNVDYFSAGDDIVMTNIKKRIKVDFSRLNRYYFVNQRDENIVDLWYSVESKFVGKINMNPAIGILNRKHLIGFFEITSLNHWKQHRVINFFIRKLILRKNSLKTIDSFEISGLYPIKSIFHFKDIIFKVRRKYVIDSVISKDSEYILSENNKLKLTLLNSITNTTFDEFVIAPINLIPNNKYGKLIMIGSNNYSILHYSLGIECFPFYGKNCKNKLKFDIKKIFSSPELFMSIESKKRQGSNFSNCQCKNNGISLQNSGGCVCRCQRNFIGARCRIFKCNSFNSHFNLATCECASILNNYICNITRCDEYEWKNCKTYEKCYKFANNLFCVNNDSIYSNNTKKYSENNVEGEISETTDMHDQKNISTYLRFSKDNPKNFESIKWINYRRSVGNRNLVIVVVLFLLIAFILIEIKFIISLILGFEILEDCIDVISGFGTNTLSKKAS